MIERTEESPLARGLKLCSRSEFRELVLARHNGKCCKCDAVATAAHHIMERRLFNDGGYYTDNGAALCDDCHLEAERTSMSCEEIRSACGIKNVVLPPHLDPQLRYDKWGNPFVSKHERMKGELFYDESVQKILIQDGFTDYVKYPRTLHLPESPGVQRDDRVLTDLSAFEGEEVVVSIKMDGENTTLYPDYHHARSIDSKKHPSRDWLTRLLPLMHEIPKGWRVCGENLFAKHSIHYKHLRHLFQVFSVWNGTQALSWYDTLEWVELLAEATDTSPADFGLVPVVYIGPFSERVIPECLKNYFWGDPVEGLVMRVTRSYRMSEHQSVVGKWVRANHVQTDSHWMSQTVERNEVQLSSR